MDVARTSMIHAAAPHFLWPFAVQYAAHQINLQPRVSLPESTPTLRWTGKVGDASVFRVWGSCAFVRDASADKVSSCADPTPSGVSHVDPVEPVEVAVDSGAARGAEPAGAGPEGAEPGVAESAGAEPWGAESERRAEPGGAEFGGAEPEGAEPERAESRGPPGVPSWQEPLSPQLLREWYARRCCRAAGATGPATGGASGSGAAGGAAGAAAAGGASGAAGGASGAAGGAAGAGAAGATGYGGTSAVGGLAGVGAAGGAGAAGPGGARTGGTGAAGAGGAAGVGAVGTEAITSGDAAGAGAAGGTGAGDAAGVVAGDPRAESSGAVSAVSGGAARPRLPTRGLTERREPESRPALPESRPASSESRPESPVRAVCTGHRVPHQCPPPLPSTHSMTLRPSTAPQRIPLPCPHASSLPALADPESDSLSTASPTITRLLATVVTDPSFESTAASALVAELVE
ncbi:unnamed protein product [Closterium sp. NIES-54]